MKRKVSRGVLAALLLMAATAGCSKKENPAPPQGPSVGPPVGQPAAQAPVQKQQSSATVMPGGRLDFSKRNDPFKPYAPAVPATPPTAAKRPAAAPSGETLPIQSFEVGQFKVAGIIAGLNENKALLIDPNGKGYVVHQGMVIGNNNGRITRITANGVEVVERVKEGGGRVREKKTVLTLAKKR